MSNKVYIFTSESKHIDMETIRHSKTFVGRLSEGADEMNISTDEGHLVGIGTFACKGLTELEHKRVKLTITVEVEEIS